MFLVFCRNKREDFGKFGQLRLWSLQLYLLAPGMDPAIFFAWSKTLQHELRCPCKTLTLQLNVLELFLDCMTEPNEKLIEFGVGGICNSCVGNSGRFAFRDIMVSTWLIIFLIDSKKKLIFFADPANAAIVTRVGGIPLIIQCLSSPVRNTVRIRTCLLTLFHFVGSWLCLALKLQNADPWAWRPKGYC